MNKTETHIEILSQGEELICGEVVDSNSAWLSRRLTSLGFRVRRHTTVGDRLPDLEMVLEEIAGRADLCIGSGGLGPTRDDLTAEAVSRAFNLPLLLDQEALRAIQACFHRRNQAMPATNRKQALLPQGSQRLDNPLGTAPGFSLQVRRCRFFFLPGVPKEMEAMYERYVAPQLPQWYSVTPERRLVIRVRGLGESRLEECLADLPMPEDMTLGYRATPGEVEVKLVFPASFDRSSVDALVAAIQSRLGQAPTTIEEIPFGGQTDSDR